MVYAFISISAYLKRKKLVIFETLHYDRYSDDSIENKYKKALRNKLVSYYLAPKKRTIKKMLN